jgi:DNA repair protein RecO
VLTPEGFLTIQARGILKLTSNMQAMASLGSWANLTFSMNRNKHFLEKADLIRFAPLPDQDGLLLTIMLQVALQILLFDETKANGAHLYQSLVDLRQAKASFPWHWLSFLKSILALQGVPMVVDYCVSCQNKSSIVGVSSELGGFICQDCIKQTSNTPLPATTLKALRQLYKQPQALLSNQEHQIPLIPLVQNHFEHHLDIHIEGFKTLQTLFEKIHL